MATRPTLEIPRPDTNQLTAEKGGPAGTTVREKSVSVTREEETEKRELTPAHKEPCPTKAGKLPNLSPYGRRFISRTMPHQMGSPVTV